VWAVSIHLITAFLFAAPPSRPLWNSPLLGPRFLASAFTAGPAFMILLLGFIRSTTSYPISEVAVSKLATATTVAAQINLVMLLSDLVFEFYFPTHHSVSAKYLLVPWIRTAIALNVLATVALTFHPVRRKARLLMPACATLFLAIWVEKGIGLVIPGFIPSPLGEIVEYTPSWVEIAVTAGIWALGLFVLTVLVRVALPIELGEVRSPYMQAKAAEPLVRPRAERSPQREIRPIRKR
jgi:molybdopterin-containing oxidoreductase family membrane subunit